MAPDEPVITGFLFSLRSFLQRFVLDAGCTSPYRTNATINFCILDEIGSATRQGGCGAEGFFVAKSSFDA